MGGEPVSWPPYTLTLSPYKPMADDQTEIKNWVLAGVVGFLTFLLGAIAKMVSSGIIKKLDEMLQELKTLNTITTRHEVEMITQRKDHDKLCADVDDLDERLRKVENQNQFLMHGANPAETL